MLVLVGSLRALHNTEVALCAGPECPKRVFVNLAFVGRERNLIAVELDENRRLLQSGFVRVNLACEASQKAAAEALNCR